MNDILQAVIMGSISGVFSGGVFYGVVKTELKFLRRDVNELRGAVFHQRSTD